MIDDHLIVKLIDKVEEANQDNGFRNHLGASVLGRECARELWYIYRWAHAVKHKGRILRLFKRGHKEEPVLVRYLQSIGAKVAEVDPRTGKQFRITYHSETIGGSCDAVIAFPEDIVRQLDEQGIKISGNGLCEFKTHGDKSFKTFQKLDVRASKPEHFVQMQIYMYMLNLKWALYLSVNKNTDELYAEIVYLIPAVAHQFLRRGQEIVDMIRPPNRIREDPSFYKCKFCDFKRICHEGREPDINCRTCKNVELILDGSQHVWYCHLFGADIPLDFSKKGCDKWEPGY